MDHKIVWKYHMGERIKTERVLQGTLCNLFAVFLKTDAKLLGNVSKCIIQEKASKKNDLLKAKKGMNQSRIINKVTQKVLTQLGVLLHSGNELFVWCGESWL